jgi:hypothetical protein
MSTYQELFQLILKSRNRRDLDTNLDSIDYSSPELLPERDLFLNQHTIVRYDDGEPHDFYLELKNALFYDSDRTVLDYIIVPPENVRGEIRKKMYVILTECNESENIMNYVFSNKKEVRKFIREHWDRRHRFGIHRERCRFQF